MSNGATIIALRDADIFIRLSNFRGDSYCASVILPFTNVTFMSL